MKIVFRTATALGVLALFLANSVSAQNTKIYSDISANELAGLLNAAQLSTTITTGPSGEPLVVAQQGGLRFIARGVNCIGDADARCSKMQFRASFALDEQPSATWMNEFNKSWVFGKAYVTVDGVARVEYPLDLTEGITEGNLIHNFVVWVNILETFIDHLSGGEIAPLM